MQLYEKQFSVFWAEVSGSLPLSLRKPALNFAESEGKEAPGWMVQFAFDRDPHDPPLARITLATVDLYRYHAVHDKGPVRWSWSSYRGDDHVTLLVNRWPSSLAAYLTGDESRVPVPWGELSLQSVPVLEMMLRRGLAQYLAHIETGEYEAVFTSVVVP